MKMKYQASIFGSIGDIEVTPDNTKTLIDLFSEKELIPSISYELEIAERVTLSPRARMGFASADQEWTIDFRADKIQIVKRATEPHGANLGALDKFCSDVSVLFDKVTSKFKKRANRIALVTDVLLEEMTDEVLFETYLKLFKMPKFYGENQPFEWDWRTASREPIDLEGLNETLNIIVRISRSSGEFQLKGEVTPFDRVRLAFDINTVPHNKEHRFDSQNIVSFYNQTLELHNSLSAKVTEFING
jgi:hypothetical protein